VSHHSGRQRIGLVVFAIGAVATAAWGVGAALTLLDLAIGVRAPTYLPWLLAGSIAVAIAVVGLLFYGGLPRVTLRTGCLGAAWGIGLLLFVGGLYDMLQAAANVRLGGPANQVAADGLIRAVVAELLLTVAVSVGIALWRRRWFPTLVAGATVLCVVGLLDNISSRWQALRSKPWPIEVFPPSSTHRANSASALAFVR
jgi:hypothetical protein